ncbi:DUF87 domain-containing protein [Mesorhizobium sp. M0027]|uniref:helicase HerA domain-containing protein n=1 Tax=Mesorhizobium sp. M0027 TaxID=2956848 RepID=UPI003337C69A
MDIAPFLDKPTAIVGTTGAGKTFAAKGAVERLLELGRRVIILDPTGAWYGLRAGADGSSEGGFPVLIFGGDHADIPIDPTAEAGKALALALAERDVQAIIDTSEMTGGEKNRFLTPFLENLYARNKAALHLIVDEADEVAAQRLADGEQRLFGAFDKIVRRGRIKGFRPLMISQRPAVIHKNVLSQIGTLIALKLTSPQDRKAIDDWVKGNADADQAKAVMKSLPTLPRGQGWVWSPADDVLRLVKFPAIRTYDSSRTPDDGETVVAPALTAVDVDALRKAMVASAAETRPAPASSTAGAEIDERDPRIQNMLKEAWSDGRKAGWAEGNAEGRALLAHVVARELGDVRSGLDRILALPQLNEDAAPPAEALNVQTETKPRAVNQIPEKPASGKPASRSIDLGAERRPLALLVAAYPAGYTEAQWASLAGFKRTGGTWGTYKSRLRTKGAVEQRGDLWFATQVGVDAIGGDIPDMPRTPDERLAMWKSKIAAVGPMLDVLRNFYPNQISRDDLAQQIGMAAGGGSFGTYLSRLRSNGLLEEPQRGFYRLTSAIMGDI